MEEWTRVCERLKGGKEAGGSPVPENPLVLSLQEPEAEKTNNGIHYRLRLVYNNGKQKLRPCWA